MVALLWIVGDVVAFDLLLLVAFGCSPVVLSVLSGSDCKLCIRGEQGLTNRASGTSMSSSSLSVVTGGSILLFESFASDCLVVVWLLSGCSCWLTGCRPGAEGWPWCNWGATACCICLTGAALASSHLGVLWTASSALSGERFDLVKSLLLLTSAWLLEAHSGFMLTMIGGFSSQFGVVCFSRFRQVAIVLCRSLHL